MTKAVTIPVTPKTGNPASVFSWLTKHFNATKHAFQGDSNPWSDRAFKTGDISAADRKALIAHCLANPNIWKQKENDSSFFWEAEGVYLHLAKHGHKDYTKYFSFSSPKKSKPSTIPYYD